MQIQGQYLPSGALAYSSAAAEETRLVYSGGGLLFALVVTNSNAAARFVYVFDAVTATGTPIVPPIPVPAGGQVTFALPFAIPYTNGLFVASSSTNATYTASGSADLRISAWYK